MSIEASQRSTTETPHIPAGDPNSIVVGYLDFIKSIVTPYSPMASKAGLEREDLIQIGAEAVMRRLPDYDLTQAELTTFIAQRIRGSVIDEVRNGYLIRVPRSVLERLGKINKAEEELSHELGRAPTLMEMSKKTKYTIEEIAEASQARESLIKSLETPITDTGGEDSLTLADVVARDEDAPEEMLRVETVHSAIKQLPPRLREVITKYYFQEKTLGRIGIEFGVTESRACQMLTKAEGIIREILEKNGVDEAK